MRTSAQRKFILMLQTNICEIFIKSSTIKDKRYNKEMKIISWNTNGLRATVKQGFFIPLFQKGKPDILCLQETKAHPEQLTEETRNVSGYFSYFSHSKLKKGYSGVAIYSKEK